MISVLCWSERKQEEEKEEEEEEEEEEWNGANNEYLRLLVL